MAVRVPRVAVEAAVALLLIGAGCFMLLDLSNKQSSTFVAKGALFSSKLEGKFQQLATAIPAAIPSPCTSALTTLAGITGVCNIVNGKSGCCSNGDLNAQLLPDLSNCTTRCQSYYVAFYCFYKCSGKQANLPANPICTDPLRTLFAACNTATCQVLNTGARVDTDTDYNAFLAANTITTATTAQGCNDFTSFGRRCEETAVPTIRNIQAVYNDDPNTNVTTFPGAGRTFNAVASPAAAASITGIAIDVCVQVLNPRPVGCDTQAADQVLFPLSVNIVVEATGAGIAPYVVANAVIASQQIESIPAAANTPALFRACLRGLRILPINVAVYNLAISATATNTFGVGTSANLSPNGNSLSISIPQPTGTGLSATAYTITGDINICNGNTGDSQTTGFLVGTNAFSVAPTTVVATFDTINCCERRTEGATQQNDGLRAECNFNAAQGQAVSVATFNANPVATTIRGATLTIRTLFEAAGSVTLINAGIVISTGANFRVQNTAPLLGQVALRGASGTSLTIANGATLTLTGTASSDIANRATRVFLITLGQVEIITQTGSAITATSADLVIAESSRLSVVGTTITLNVDSRVVQYTDAIGGINMTTLATDLNGVAPRQTVVSPVTANGGIVAVSGTFLAFAPFTTTALTTAQNDLRRVIFNTNVRISRSRGPDAPVSGADTNNDNTAVPLDAQIPGQPVTSFQQTTEAKFAEQIATPVNSRATLNLCGTENLAGSTITIPSTGTLLVQPPSGVTRCLVPNSSPAASLITDNLTVRTGGQVTITNVDRQFNPIRINTGLLFENGASIVVFLAAGIDTTAFTGLNLFSFPAGSAAATTFCNTLPVVEFRNAGNRVVTPTCNPATGTLSLAFTAVQATAPPQANPSLYTSTNEYCLLVRQDLTTFDRSSFLNAIDANFASSGTTRNLVTVTTLGTDSTNSNNLRVVFRCYDFSSVANADVRCQNILSVASNTNSGFAQQTLANGFCGSSAVFPTGIRNESNHGLYGLFGLVAIPILLGLLIFLLVRNSRRRADNQYMQDAATFSNVASGPQPLATAVPSVQYDVAKEIYPVVAAPAYPAY